MRVALRLLSPQRAKIGTRGFLENAQIKFRHNGENMIENIGLDRLVIGPDDIFAKHVDLDR